MPKPSALPRRVSAARRPAAAVCAPAGDRLEDRVMLAGVDAVDDMLGPFSDDVDTSFALAELTDNDDVSMGGELDQFTQPSAGSLAYDPSTQAFTYTPGEALPGDVTFTYTLAGVGLGADGALAPAAAEAGAEFGFAAAADGDLAVITAPGENAAYVFERDAEGAFGAPVRIEPTSPGSVRLGEAVDVDNGRIVLGDPGVAGGGRAVVFEPDGSGGYAEAAVLSLADGLEGDLFGGAVAIDGDRVAVGAMGREGADVSESGAVSVYERQSDGSYALAQTIDDPFGNNPGNDDSNGFGAALALEGDRLAVSSLDGSTDNSANGLVFVYDADASGDFQLSQTVESGLTDETFAQFGSALALQGDELLVGAVSANAGGVTTAGAALLFERQDGGGYALQQRLQAEGPATSDRFGATLSFEGDTIAVGSPDAGVGGRVIAFRRSGGGAFDRDGSVDGGSDENFGSAVAVSGGQIIVGSPSADDDAETADSGAATLLAFDAAATDTATVTITLAEVNDAPRLDDAAADVPADATAGDLAIDLAAVDPDGDEVTYAITAGNEDGAFAIDADTGEITVADPAALTDADGPRTFTLDVLVSDNQSPAGTDTAVVTLSVVGGNRAPVLEDAAAEVSPTAEAGDTVIDLAATDPDGDSLTYAITAGNEDGAFAIDADTGEITVLDPAALPAVASLTVTVSDDGDPVLSDTATVTVTRTNRAPMLDDETATVSSEATAGDLVIDLDATDEDAGDALTFAITSGNESGAFAIDADTGEVTVADATALSGTFTLGVTVSDDRDPAGTDTATLTVEVQEPNNAPVLDDETVEIPRDAMAGDLVIDLAATDADGDDLTYAITAGNGSGAFAIDADTGEITVANAAAVPETAALTVSVSDGELTDTATVTVDRAAENTAPTLANRSVTLPREAEDGDLVVDLDAVDAEGDELTYEIVGGNGSGAFAIDADTGEVTVADASAVPESAVLAIRVTDDGVPAGAADATLTITRAVAPQGVRGGVLFVTEDGEILRTDGGRAVSLGSLPDADYESILTGDFNGDNVTDVAALNEATGEWTVALSDGDGLSIRTAGVFDPSVNYAQFLAGDFNGDGRDDLAARDLTTGSWTVGFTGEDGLLTLDTRWARWTATRDWLGVRAGDFDGDGADDIIGRADLAAGVGNGGGVYVSGLNVASPNASLTVGATNVFTLSPALNWEDERVLDVNGDGRDDLMSRRADTNAFYTGVSQAGSDPLRMPVSRTGIIGFTAAGARPLSDILVGRFTDDGRDDVVVRFADTGTVWRGTSDGSRFAFEHAGRVVGETLADAVAADLTGDGLDDLLFRDPAGNEATLLTAGAGDFANSPADILDEDETVLEAFAAFIADDAA